MADKNTKKEEQATASESVEREYLFPAFSITVKASSKEEAEKKLDDIIKARSNK